MNVIFVLVVNTLRLIKYIRGDNHRQKKIIPIDYIDGENRFMEST